MIDSIRLALRRCSDPGLDCIVCRRGRVDAAITYGTTGGVADQGIHLRCIGRAQVKLGGQRRRAPTPTTKTYEDGLSDAAAVAGRIAWEWGARADRHNRNPALDVHRAILALPASPKTSR